jgi:3-hydroxyacyl-[acyl-carrier-protein] dehydratase
VAQIDLMFSHIDRNLGGKQFPKENFVFTDMFMSLLQGFITRPAGAESSL